MEAHRRYLGLAVEDGELEAAGIGRHMAGNQRRELLTNELMVHGKSPEKGTSRPQGTGCPKWVDWMDAVRPEEDESQHAIGMPRSRWP